jgi:hypothetical protein
MNVIPWWNWDDLGGEWKESDFNNESRTEEKFSELIKLPVDILR